MLHQDLQRDHMPLWGYFCQISDSTTSYGSYSGAVPNEKITWGKLGRDAQVHHRVRRHDRRPAHLRLGARGVTHGEPARERDIALPAPARGQSGGLVPLGPEAFDAARSKDRPIFLSIGYSTCHWCHVMAHESFENPAVAALLNEHFVSIKLDREERPDVDRVYMSYLQGLTGQGGWPLSVWLTPDLKPFYAGTYFAPEDRHGRAGFPTILRAIARGWREDRARLVAESERVVESLNERAGERTAPAEGAVATFAEAAGAAFEKAYRYYAESFDPRHGGFGGAPKFPRPANLAFLLRCSVLQGTESEAGLEASGMVASTLRAMARGGIHDHVGGGFHRYSVDDEWFVPHFEKMLYDQAQIACCALEAWQATGDERHAWLAADVLDYVLRDLTAPEGGFYSAEDADSPAGEGGEPTEGAFYVWTREEMERALGADAPFACGHFGVRPEGNVPRERDPHQEFTGRNILAQARSLADSAKEHGLELQAASDLLQSCLERLRAARSERRRPHLDDKVIAGWNGLMITALSRAAIRSRGVPRRPPRGVSGRGAPRGLICGGRTLQPSRRRFRAGHGAAAGVRAPALPRTARSSSRPGSTFTMRPSTRPGSSGRRGSRRRWTGTSGIRRRAAISTRRPGQPMSWSV
jgi:hypothetical protein